MSSAQTPLASQIGWIAFDPASLRVLEMAQKVAPTATTLLITGESGSGKDHLARLIHELGPRHDAPFLKIDCASLPQELVESELFGHERGAFTGAVERKLGRFELSYGGTVPRRFIFSVKCCEHSHSSVARTTSRYCAAGRTFIGAFGCGAQSNRRTIF